MKIALIAILGLLLTGCADIHAYDAQLAEKDATIAKLQGEIMSKDAEIASDSDRIRNLEIDIAQCNREYNQLFSGTLSSNLKYFSTVGDLKGFLLIDDTDKSKYSSGYKCTDYAVRLMRNAEKLGYVMFLYPKNETHMMNCTIIGSLSYGSIYIVEPQTDEIIFNGTFTTEVK